MKLIRPLRIGIVPYVNVLPLLAGLDRIFPTENWVRATPRELADLLMRDEVDVAVVSSFEGIRRGYAFVPNVMIGSWGNVRSVALYSKVPIHQVRNVLLDKASLTSIHLYKILCAEQLSIDPPTTVSDVPFKADFAWRECAHDAFLAIGDVCLAWENAFPHKLDLGEAWSRLTGLPFVFAGWCLRPSFQLTADELAVFSLARVKGEHEAHLLAEHAAKLPTFAGITPESLFEYLTGAIRYRMGSREIDGLKLFRQKLITHKILDPETPEVALALPAM